MIEIQNISKTFGNKQVLENVSAVFDRNKTNLIIGASGTGKSVLLKCIVGLIKVDSGASFFDGRNLFLAHKGLQAEIRRDIGMLFQGGALFDSMNVQENIMFPLNMLTSLSQSEKVEKVNFYLEKVGLGGVNKKMPSELSGGMKKRVGIARALVNQSQYLFCDEPNSGLDPQTSTKIDNLIQDITRDLKMTTIVVTHDMNSVMQIGEKIMFLHEGKKMWEGTSDSLVKSGINELNEFIFANKLMRMLRQ